MRNNADLPALASLFTDVYFAELLRRQVLSSQLFIVAEAALILCEP